jgi:hypothetical protein
VQQEGAFQAARGFRFHRVSRVERQEIVVIS